MTPLTDPAILTRIAWLRLEGFKWDEKPWETVVNSEGEFYSSEWFKTTYTNKPEVDEPFDGVFVYANTKWGSRSIAWVPDEKQQLTYVMVRPHG